MKLRTFAVLAAALTVLSALLLDACTGGGGETDTATLTEEESTAMENTQAPTEAVTEVPTEPPTEAPSEAPSEAPTEAPTEASTEAPTEAATETPWQGEDMERDPSTPKKYITLSFDDGITQDARMIEIFKKYGCPCTFNINTGLFGVKWDWVADAVGKPGLSHQRWTRKEITSGIYDGFDIEVHTLSHGSLKDMSDKQVIQEVGNDAKNITRLFGYKPVGMAYPGGDSEVNEHNIETILANTDIRFGRGITSTYSFALPEYFMMWQPTCSFSDGQLLSLTDTFLKADCTEDMLLYVWGHSYELDIYDTWDKLETFVKTITEAAAEDDTIVLCTNAQFYQMFKNEIPAWKE